MERVSNWIIFLNFLNNNQGLITLFELIIALGTLCIFIGIFIVTRNHANSTRDLAKEIAVSVTITEESMRITKEKDRVDRTFKYLAKFDNKRFIE